LITETSHGPPSVSNRAYPEENHIQVVWLNVMQSFQRKIRQFTNLPTSAKYHKRSP